MTGPHQGYADWVATGHDAVGSASSDRFGLLAVAQAYVDRQASLGELVPRSMAGLADVRVRPDEEFCREVARHFACAPRRESNVGLREGYARLKAESLNQFRLVQDTGLRIQPWLASGQPYRGSRDLIARLAESGVLYVYLTRDGHGRGKSAADHPMCEPSGIRVRGVDFLFNDVFRAVHDLFGHVMYGYSMGVMGEFRAAFCHMAMYSGPAHPILFSEQISQICWFFYGPHLEDPSGRLPARGEPWWIPPGQRPYPEQKVFPCPPDFVARFKASFQEASG
jgi:hypothetical protein